jgi:pimeloyl-ACP methyl ester carboxylesterase
MKVGEIVAAATTTFTAQSYELNRAPAFGSLLRVPVPGAGGHSPLYYALCSGAQTGAIEPGRHAVAWGRGDDDEADIYRRQPQLSQVLRTTFDALLVGYSNGGAVVQRVPAMPPRLHALVYEATGDEVARFNADLSYLRFVLRTPLPNADDFIAATIEHAQRAIGGDRAFLVAAARTIARLLGSEHERVMNILELLDG